MTLNKILQTTFDEKGNCLQAVIATLFNIPIDDIPCFADDEDNWIYSMSQWMTKNFNKFVVSIKFVDPKEIKLLNNSLIITTINSPNPKVERHAVISKNGKIVFDPMVGGLNIKLTDNMEPLYLLIGDVLY